MLVLTRKIGESIRINDIISVTILAADSRSVKIGIDAPRDVRIHREEVFQKIQLENRAAADITKQHSVQDIVALLKWQKAHSTDKPLLSTDLES